LKGDWGLVESFGVGMGERIDRGGGEGEGDWWNLRES